MSIDHSRTPAAILAEWRETERKLAGCEASSDEYDELAARVRQLARAYSDSLKRDGEASDDRASISRQRG
jgi:hypothetical protein